MTDEAIYELAREIAAEEGKGDRETYIEMLQNRLKWAIDTLEEIHEELSTNQNSWKPCTPI